MNIVKRLTKYPEGLMIPLGLGTAYGMLFLSGFGAFGSRGIETVYPFEYKGKPAKVIRENIRFGADRYFIEIDKARINGGEVISDELERIRVWRSLNIFKWHPLAYSGDYSISVEEK